MVMTFSEKPEPRNVILRRYTRFLKEFPENTHILHEWADWLLCHNYYRKAAWKNVADATKFYKKRQKREPILMRLID